MEEKQIVVYESDNGLQLDVNTDGETVWVSIEQMVKLFGRDQSVISRHVNAVFSEGELPKEGYMQIMHKTSHEGGRPVAFYNLDVLISVGYRVKSIQGTRFRQWATRILREMLLNRVAELKRIDSLEQRMVSVEDNIDQIREGVDYLAQQLDPDTDIPHQRMGFGAKSGEMVDQPYGKKR